MTLAVTFFVLTGAGFAIYGFARKQALSGAPLPRLYKKAMRSQPQRTPQTPHLVSSAEKSSKPSVWFNDIQTPLKLSDSEAKAIVRFMAAQVMPDKGPPQGFPGHLKADASQRIIFVSVSDGLSAARVIMGSGQGLHAAIKQAVTQIRNLPLKAGRLKWLKFDVVQAVFSIREAGLTRPLKREPSIYGIAFGKESAAAFLPEELMAHRLINKKHILRLGNIAAYLKERAVSGGQIPRLDPVKDRPRFRFTTNGYFFDGETTIPLYRGHRVYQEVFRDQLLSAAIRGGEYLVRAVGSSGKFDYSYRSEKDQVRAKYNIIRHAGTVYAMLELYETTGASELLRAARNAIRYLLDFVQPYRINNSEAACVVDKGYVKLGGNALAIIGLSKYTEVSQSREFLPLAARLGRWIQNAQNETGKFFIQKQRYPEGIIEKFVSQYYPGEAILALVRLYKLLPDESWLDTAEKGARYLIEVRDRDTPEPQLIHDHWLLYALNELYRLRPKPLYLKHALRITRAIMGAQNRDPAWPDWRGSYYRPPRSTPTATRSEGLYAAYQLCRDFGDATEAQKILQSVRRGAAFQLQTQFRPETVLYLKNPQRALGGFRRSLTHFEIRIDYVQHNISSLLGLYHIINGIE